MAFHQTQNKDKLAHLTAKDCQQHHSHMPVPSYTQYKCSHYWDITSINCICRKESCENLVVRPSVQPYMTKMPGWLQKLSHGNEHWAVNTCKYWQGWPQAKRATAHLDLNRFSGMTKFPPHCLPTHEHALQKCPLATSKKRNWDLSSIHLVEHTQSKPGLSLNPASVHPPLHWNTSISLCQSACLSHTHMQPKYDLSAVKNNIYHTVMGHYTNHCNHQYVISLQPWK